MSTTANLGITLLEAGLRQPEVRINDALTALDAQIVLPTSWTPTWTNLSIGNGTVVAKYGRSGKWIVCRLSIVLGSTTLISGSVSFTLPATRAAYGGSAGVTPLGTCYLFDTSALIVLQGTITNASPTTGLIAVWKADGTYSQSALLSSTVPFTWATGDEIGMQFLYEAA